MSNASESSMERKTETSGKQQKIAAYGVLKMMLPTLFRSARQLKVLLPTPGMKMMKHALLLQSWRTKMARRIAKPALQQQSNAVTTVNRLHAEASQRKNQLTQQIINKIPIKESKAHNEQFQINTKT